jgi:hypothetical protein
LARSTVTTEGLKVFAKQMRAIDRKLGTATAAELRAIGNKVRDNIRAGTDAPRSESAANDSQGIAGRKRRSIKTSVRVGGVSLYSREPDAGVWNWGGTIRPRGAPIKIPRTEFVSGQVQREAKEIEAGLLGLVEGLSRRYAEFT